jgi:hypothetical protein
MSPVVAQKARDTPKHAKGFDGTRSFRFTHVCGFPTERIQNFTYAQRFPHIEMRVHAAMLCRAPYAIRLVDFPPSHPALLPVNIMK